MMSDEEMVLQAAYEGNETAVRDGLNNGVGVECKSSNEHQETPLYAASKAGQVAVMKMLLQEYKANVNTRDFWGKSALQRASMEGQVDAVKLLVAYGAKKDSRDKNGGTAASRCCDDMDAAAEIVKEKTKREILAVLNSPSPPPSPQRVILPRPAPPPDRPYCFIAAIVLVPLLALRITWLWSTKAGSAAPLAPCAGPSAGQPQCAAKPWNTPAADLPAPRECRYDVFVSHAGKDADKRPFANALYDMLRFFGMHVFLDERSLLPGQNASEEMDLAMKSACVGLLLLSKEFFERSDPLWELRVLARRMQERRADVLPVFLRIKWEETKLEALIRQLPSHEVELREYAGEINIVRGVVGIRHAGEYTEGKGVAMKKSEDETKREIAYRLCQLLHEGPVRADACYKDGINAWNAARVPR